MDTITIISGGALLVALAGAIVAYLSITREMAVARKEISRFKLFAVRDHLVMLVACGQMEETDEAWRSSYVAVNSLLDMDAKLDAYDVFRHFIGFALRMAREPMLQRKYDLLIRKHRDAEKRIPEYAAVREEMGAAFRHLVRARTTKIHRAFVLGTKLLLISLSVGIDTAVAVKNVATARSLDHISGWQNLQPSFA